MYTVDQRLDIDQFLGRGRRALFSYMSYISIYPQAIALHLTPKGREAVVESISSTRDTQGRTRIKTENDSAHTTYTLQVHDYIRTRCVHGAAVPVN